MTLDKPTTKLPLTVDTVKNLISTRKDAAIRALKLIYEKQTSSEQDAQSTIDNNGIGFNGVDAEILTSIYQFYQKNGYISPKQLAICYKKLPKYAKQIVKITEEIQSN